MSEETPLQSEDKPLFCLVLMPFLPDLYYFFLYLQLYIQTEFPMICERGDTCVTTKSINDKIINKIREADVVIADCTGSNPNVMYELGIAVASDRQVILIAHAGTKLPTDINNMDALWYSFDSHEHFISRLHTLLKGILETKPLGRIYEAYIALVEAYNRFSTFHDKLTMEEFAKLLQADYKATREKPLSREMPALSQLLLGPENSKLMHDLSRLFDGTTH